MDAESQGKLGRMLRGQRIAALGTQSKDGPRVAMVLYALAPDASTPLIHISGLARHTRDILQDSRVSLMISETDPGTGDPQTLARVSIQGEAQAISQEDRDYRALRAAYLGKFPQAERLFQLGDFMLVRIQPRRARYVAGFAKTFNLGAADLQEAAASEA